MPLKWYGRREATFLKAEIATSLARTPYLAQDDTTTAGWIDIHTYRDRRGEWVTLLGARHTHRGIRSRNLRRWWDHNCPCRFLTDARAKRRAVTTQRVVPPVKRNRDKVRVYLVADLDAIVEAMKAAKFDVVNVRGDDRRLPEAVYTDARGRWLTEVQARELLGFTATALAYWSDPERRSKVRGDGKPPLRSKKVTNALTGRGGPGEVKAFLENDILTIQDGREGKGPGIGTGRNADRLRGEMLTKAKEAYCAILAGGARLAPSEVLNLARTRYGVGASFIRKVHRLYGKRVKGEWNQPYLWTLLPGVGAGPSVGTGGAVPAARPRPTATDNSRGGRPPRTEMAAATTQAKPTAPSLPKRISGPDLAHFLGLPRHRVVSALRRFRAAHPDCFDEIDNPRENEPRIIYRTAAIAPVIDKLRQK
jgi:hypothetical protein